MRFVLTLAVVALFSYLLVGRAVDFEHARAGMLSERERVGIVAENSAASGRAQKLVASHSRTPSLIGSRSESVQPLYQNRSARWWARRAVQARKDANARGRTIRRLKRELAAALQPPTVATWAEIQIRYATLIAVASAGDPWPNCPDPHDGSGASWYDTVRCENGGSWLDSPGYYRCGLQFDPMWERHYGRRFCP